ncbi:sporulation histidine kinase inhibitor Sda [Metabacillus halosaccharovorans]|nr:sporulation histidine kinase inhibitor Sda [Metabacillus halosaccharovorans]MCM3443651.1 sporulation histidine kinase inhibitor Sda [Metabacillus halosaccharovorans]
MPKLSDEFLLSSYKKAVKLNIDSYFLYLLITEIKRRNLVVNIK